MSIYKIPRINYPLSELDVKGINDFFKNASYLLGGNVDFVNLKKEVTNTIDGKVDTTSFETTLDTDYAFTGKITATQIKGGTLEINGTTGTDIKFTSPSNPGQYGYIDYHTDDSLYAFWGTQGHNGAMVIGVVGSAVYDVIVLKAAARVLIQGAGLTFRDYANTVAFDFCMDTIPGLTGSAILPRISTGFGDVRIGAATSTATYYHTTSNYNRFNKQINIGAGSGTALYIDDGGDIAISPAIAGNAVTSMYNDDGYMQFNTQIKTPGYVTPSDRNLKTDIKDFDSNYAYELVKKMKVYKYRYDPVKFSRKLDDGGIEHIGIMADESPAEVTSKDGKGVELYSYISTLAGALQEVIRKVEKLSAKTV